FRRSSQQQVERRGSPSHRTLRAHRVPPARQRPATSTPLGQRDPTLTFDVDRTCREGEVSWPELVYKLWCVRKGSDVHPRGWRLLEACTVGLGFASSPGGGVWLPTRTLSSRWAEAMLGQAVKWDRDCNKRETEDFDNSLCSGQGFFRGYAGLE
ncbi:hypothetical protein CSPAE12_02398, partial [Colletotrichum incanum]